MPALPMAVHTVVGQGLQQLLMAGRLVAPRSGLGSVQQVQAAVDGAVLVVPAVVVESAVRLPLTGVGIALWCQA